MPASRSRVSVPYASAWFGVIHKNDLACFTWFIVCAVFPPPIPILIIVNLVWLCSFVLISFCIYSSCSISSLIVFVFISLKLNLYLFSSIKTTSFFIILSVAIFFIFGLFSSFLTSVLYVYSFIKFVFISLKLNLYLSSSSSIVSSFIIL